ncbi:MAG TPA: hypothetical protein PKO06_09170 [Candidatus Ozemobacteraceae bacterium]|nr:hypothetical protein [Candidatus Ozemobacteraceae bacterium]
MHKSVWRALFLGNLVVVGLFGPTIVATAEDPEVKIEEEKEAAKQAATEGRKQYEEALKLKRSGKWDDAIQMYEKAIRADRSILGDDDEGLMTALQKTYETKLASDSENLYLLEGLGYISAVGFSDFDKAIRYYQKVVELSKDEAVKERTGNLIERLRAQADLAKQMTADVSAQSREDRIKQWAELEKQDAAAAQAEKSQQREEKLSELYTKRDDLEARMPQIEDEIKNLQEDVDHNRRMYLNSNDRTYKRRQDRLEDDLESKKRELQRIKDDLVKTNSDITKTAGEKLETAPAKPNPPTSPDATTPGGAPDPNLPPDPNQPVDPNNPPDPSAQPQPGDPSLPPMQSPDFPPDPGAGSPPPADGSGAGTTPPPAGDASAPADASAPPA